MTEISITGKNGSIETSFEAVVNERLRLLDFVVAAEKRRTELDIMLENAKKQLEILEVVLNHVDIKGDL